MLSGGIYKAAIFTTLAATAASAAFIYIKWSGMREENDETSRDAAKLAYQIKSLQDELAYKKEYYRRLLHDDKFAGRIIREKLGFVGPNEIVFRFEDSGEVKIDDGTIMPNFAPPTFTKKKSPAAPMQAESKAAPRNAADADGNGNNTAAVTKKKGFFAKIFAALFGSDKALQNDSESENIQTASTVKTGASEENSAENENSSATQKYEFKIDMSKYVKRSDGEEDDDGLAAAPNGADATSYNQSAEIPISDASAGKLVNAVPPKRAVILKLGGGRGQYGTRSVSAESRIVRFVN